MGARTAWLASLLRLGCLVLLVATSWETARAGTIALAWDPVTEEDLAGYRVFYGTAPGTYTQQRDAGDTTQTTLDRLDDCTTWYLAVKAYDAGGNESEQYSNEVSGWPRPDVSAVIPDTAEAGSQWTLTLEGTNFRDGSTVEFFNPGISVLSVTVLSCSQLRVEIAIADDAPRGPVDIDVLHPDRVYGRGTGLFRVTEPAIPPTITEQPQDQTVERGQAATFRLTAAGTEPLQYQWYRDGAPIPGAISATYTTPPTTAQDDGATFHAVVRNSAGSDTSETARLTVVDSTPPQIANLEAVDVAATTATIRWTTDEPADSLVRYRVQGGSEYLETELDPAQVTEHAVVLHGLAPETTYAFHVVSRDGAGNASRSEPDETLTTTASPYHFLRFEAEHADTQAPLAVLEDGDAFGGQALELPADAAPGSIDSPSGRARFGVHIPAAGTWRLWLRVRASAAGMAVWSEALDGGRPAAVRTARAERWHWVESRSYPLDPGLHELEVGGLAPGAAVDRILFSDDPEFVPAEAPVDDRVPPAPVSAFTATPGPGKNTLDWTNPEDPDYARTVIRFRTDGLYPTSPVDGFPVTEDPASPATTRSYVHSGLENGVTYVYSAFAVDRQGNVARAAHAAGTPPGDRRPGPVRNLRRRDKQSGAP